MTDLWAASKSNVDSLSARLKHMLMQHPNAVVILDLLGDSSVIFV